MIKSDRLYYPKGNQLSCNWHEGEYGECARCGKSKFIGDPRPYMKTESVGSENENKNRDELI